MNNIIILPSYEPDSKLVGTVRGLIEEGFDDIIVINDGSSQSCDLYFNQVNSYNQVTLLSHEVNKGKGRAMKTGFKYVLENRRDAFCVVTVDGDGQHLSKDIKRCLEEAEKYKDSIILGVRNFNNDNVPFKSRFGNNLTRMVFKMCGITISDTQTGLRAIPVKYLKEMLKIEGDRYEYETEQLLVIHNLNINLREVVIDTVYIDDNDSSHFNPVKDSIKIYKVIFRHIFRNRKNIFQGLKYAISSLTSFVLDFLAFTIINLSLANLSVAGQYRLLLATYVARAISSIYNYAMNRNFVFKSNTKIAKSAVKYFLLVICQAAVSYCGVFVLAEVLLGMKGSVLESLIKMAVDIGLFFISFNIQKKWIFRER